MHWRCSSLVLSLGKLVPSCNHVCVFDGWPSPGGGQSGSCIVWATGIVHRSPAFVFLTSIMYSHGSRCCVGTLISMGRAGPDLILVVLPSFWVHTSVTALTRWLLLMTPWDLPDISPCNGLVSAPDHHLNQCWLIVTEVLSHSPVDNFTGNCTSKF